MGGGLGPSDVGTAVGGTIVHEDQLPVGERLGVDRLDGFGQEALLIEEDDDGRDGWRVSSPYFG